MYKRQAHEYLAEKFAALGYALHCAGDLPGFYAAKMCISDRFKPHAALILLMYPSFWNITTTMP